MNKADFLQSLSEREWVGSLSGDPIPAEVYPKGHVLEGQQFAKADGTKWYMQQVRDESSGVCVYRNIHFYVVDEGLATERTLEKDKVSDSVVTKKERPFTEKINKKARNSGDIIIQEINELSKAAIVRRFVQNGVAVSEKRFLVNEDELGKLKVTEII